jgi:hypothetical protein
MCLHTSLYCSLILSLLPLHHRSALGQPLQQTLLHVLPKVPRRGISEACM